MLARLIPPLTPSEGLTTDEAVSLGTLVADAARFRARYDEALPRVYRYILTRCGDQELAEEITQEAFVEAIRSRRRFQGRSDPVTWVIAIARNRLVDHIRHKRRTRRHHLRHAFRRSAEQRCPER